uniref:Putative secreted protein n=1 Tax=Ixodes ricinus TaxID=34613 RepID=A0A6B0UG66_IXORI
MKVCIIVWNLLSPGNVVGTFVNINENSWRLKAHAYFCLETENSLLILILFDKFAALPKNKCLILLCSIFPKFTEFSRVYVNALKMCCIVQSCTQENVF